MKIKIIAILTLLVLFVNMASSCNENISENPTEAPTAAPTEAPTEGETERPPYTEIPVDESLLKYVYLLGNQAISFPAENKAYRQR